MSCEVLDRKLQEKLRAAASEPLAQPTSPKTKINERPQIQDKSLQELPRTSLGAFEAKLIAQMLRRMDECHRHPFAPYDDLHAPTLRTYTPKLYPDLLQGDPKMDIVNNSR